MCLVCAVKMLSALCSFVLSKCCERCVRVLCGVCTVNVCGVLLAWCVQIKRMMRGIGNMLFSTYSQTLNG